MQEASGASPVVELAPVAEFLRLTLPFDVLSDEDFAQALNALLIQYHRHGERLTHQAQPAGLRILRSGAVDIRNSEGKLLDRLGEGESFHIGGLNAGDGQVAALVIEDALVYLLPQHIYQSLRSANRDFDRYFTHQRSRRLRRAARYEPDASPLLQPVAEVMTSDLLTVAPAASVQQVARAMSQRRVSCALVVEGDSLLGIVTDRDLRSRCLAPGLPAETPVQAVMTPEPLAIDAGETLFAATLAMTQHGCHHLPVMRNGLLRGIVTTSDLTLARRNDPVYLAQHLSRQNSVQGLREVVSGLPDLMVHWVQAGMRAEQVSRLLTAISDTVTVRLIRLVEADLGPAPVPWCWLAFGSQARGEQLLGADQDNGIVIGDGVAEADLDWFQELAQRVCDGLADCGYSYCPGGVMATTAAWRQTLAGWQDTVRQWTRTPTPDAVMRVSIFFDLRSVHGDADLCRALQATMLERAQADTIFLAALAENVLDSRPPLGIFRRFVVDRDGEHRDSLDLKKRGVLPLTEIVRLHALAAGLAQVNTTERLQALADAKCLSIVDARNLADALHCIQQQRIRHQCELITGGEPVTNFLNPRVLPRLAREQLRDAFTIIDEAQAGVRQSYRAGMG